MAFLSDEDLALMLGLVHTFECDTAAESQHLMNFYMMGRPAIAWLPSCLCSLAAVREEEDGAKPIGGQ